MDDVIVAKVGSIERRLFRIQEEALKGDYVDNFTTQDAIVLNIQRLAQLCMDAGLHIIKINKWGIPGESREIFEILRAKGFIGKALSENLQKMVGFRNLAIHQYKNLNTDILKSLIENGFSDVIEFKGVLIERC